MKLPYFDEITPSEVEEYYEAQAELEGRIVDLDLNFEAESIDVDSLRPVAAFLTLLREMVSHGRSAIAADFDLGDNSTVVKDYLAIHESIGGEIRDTLGDPPVSKTRFLSALNIDRIGIYPEEKDGFAIIDFILGDGITNYLIVVTFNTSGEITDLGIES